MTAFHTSLLLAQDTSPGSGLVGMLPLLLMFAVIYFIVLRPMSKQDKDRRKRVEKVERGDQVVLGGGILGRISSVDDQIAVVEIADRVKVRVLKKDIVDMQDSVLKPAQSQKAASKEPSKAEPNKAEPNKAEASEAKPSEAKGSQDEAR